MKKSTAVRFPALLLIAVVLFIAPLLGCNRNYEEFAITDVKTDIVSCDFENQALIIAWETNQEAQSMISYCTSDNICVGSDTEPDYSTLHLFICGTTDTTEYYTIRVTSKTGEIAEYSFANPLTK